VHCCKQFDFQKYVLFMQYKITSEKPACEGLYTMGVKRTVHNIPCFKGL
jgi:hypothetical protein